MKRSILDEIAAERDRHDRKFGPQHAVPNGTGGARARQDARIARALCDALTDRGEKNWRVILAEEVAEAFAEHNPDKLREELIQVAAVAAAWVESIDMKAAGLPL